MFCFLTVSLNMMCFCVVFSQFHSTGRAFKSAFNFNFFLFIFDMFSLYFYLTLFKQNITTSCWMKLSENNTKTHPVEWNWQKTKHKHILLNETVRKQNITTYCWQYGYVLFSDSFIQQDVFMFCFLTVSLNMMCFCVVFSQFHSTGRAFKSAFNFNQ
jgi:hypothetical protein